MKKMFVVFVFCIFSIFSFAANCSAAELAGTTSLALEGVGEILSNNLNSSQTFGTPVTVGDFTVIPVVSKSVIFGIGTKIEDLGRKATKKNLGNSESKIKDRITLGALGQSRPVALIFIGKNGEFKVVKLEDSFVSQIAKYIAPRIPSIIGKLIEYTKNYFSKKAKGPKAQKNHKKFKNNTRKPKRKIDIRKSRSNKNKTTKLKMKQKYYLSPRQRAIKKAYGKYFKNRTFPKHEMMKYNQTKKTEYEISK